jgi:tetratricopeptide (TPR) repeat protein
MKTGRLAYITIPNGIRRELRRAFSGGCEFDPAVPLPVELPRISEAEDSSTAVQGSPACGSSPACGGSLTAEMILSGILLDLAENPAGKNSGYYRQLITALRPDIAGELEKAARIKAHNGDYDSALEILGLLEGLQGQTPAQLRTLIQEERAAASSEEDNAFREAVSLIRGGDEEGGIRRAREFLEQRPGAGQGWFILGWGLRRRSRWEEGTACFEKALELGCANADTRNELAICRMETGDLDGAEGELEKALGLEPDNVKILSNLGILAMKRGNPEKAEALFRTVLELEPDDPVAGAYFGK